MSVNKYDSQYYQDNPQMAARSRELDQQRDSKAVRDYATREELRLRYSAAHRNSCPVFKAHRVPFESCGSCCKAFEDEVAKRTAR